MEPLLFVVSDHSPSRLHPSECERRRSRLAFFNIPPGAGYLLVLGAGTRIGELEKLCEEEDRQGPRDEYLPVCLSVFLSFFAPSLFIRTDTMNLRADEV